MNRVLNHPAEENVQDKTKDWQLELLMEKLRSKAGQCKPLAEISKNVRMTLLDKRFALDSVEKTQHQKCLDTLQHSIKVTSLQSMVERLESLTRQLGLKFQIASAVELFISSDMFYLEIILEQNGQVSDVKVHHDGKQEQQSCEELVSCLSKGDFNDFTAQLEGFASIYQLNAEKMVKCKAFTALQSLESDLYTLAQLQNGMIKEAFNLLHKSPVGLLEKRRGGHPMKLTYFVSPYDLIDKEKENLEVLTVEGITEKKLGYSVTVYMEGSVAQKLQTSTLVTVKTVNGKSSPTYAAITALNSAVIPAYFVLRLNRPMPICVALLRQIQAITELEVCDTTSTHPLLSLICTHTSDGKMDSANNKGLFVTLPDQQHCYFLTENRQFDGVLVHSIPFTHPSHVAQILVILRQQALFNTIIASCVRPNSKQDFENMVILEISALSHTHISIALEHPYDETMATAEIDLSDISSLTCRIYRAITTSNPSIVTPTILTPSNILTSSSNPLLNPLLSTLPTTNNTTANSTNNSSSLSECNNTTAAGGSSTVNSDATSLLATVVLNRSFSVPVTMRAVLQHWEKPPVSPTVRKVGGGNSGSGNGGNNGHFTGLENFNLPLGASEPPGGKNGGSGTNGGGNSGGGSIAGGDFEGKLKQESGGSSGLGHGVDLGMLSHQHQVSGLFLNESLMGSANFTQFPSNTQNTTINDSTDTANVAAAAAVMLTNIELTHILTGDNHPKKKDSNDWKNPSTIIDNDNSSLVDHLLQLDEGSNEKEVLGFHSELEEAVEMLTSGKSNLELLKSQLKDGEMEELLKIDNKSKGESLGDVCGKTVIPPSVSITPIPANSPSLFPQSLNRPGIEIIPITTVTVATTLPSSITITPIAATQSTNSTTSEKSNRENKKSSSSSSSSNSSGGGKSRSSSEDRARLDKKRKRRREDSPMGPPEKIPTKNTTENLLKSVSVSISPPLQMSNTPNSPNMIRNSGQSSNNNIKYNSQNSPNRSSSLISSSSSSSQSGKISPSGGLLKKTSGQSPKHGAGNNSSPKYSGVNSPKHPGSSPKHPSSVGGGGGSTGGKPSMSALKNATNSPSSKSSGGGSLGGDGSKGKSSSGGKEGSSRDKEGKKLFSGSGGSGSGGSPKSQQGKSSNKVKPLDLNAGLEILGPIPDGLLSPTGLDLSKSSSAANQARNRKGSLSAIVDKLKSAHNCDSPTDLTSKSSSSTTSSSNPGKATANQNTGGSNPNKSSSNSPSLSQKSGNLDSKSSSEYMVKPSSDGMKITINKTRTKETKNSQSGGKNMSGTGTGSPKTHTGLKPGVNSGPASKKPQQSSLKSTSSTTSNQNLNYSSNPLKSGSNSSKTGLNSAGNPGKVNSSSNSSSTSLKSSSGKTSSPKSSATDLTRGGQSKDRSKLTKSSAEKSIFSLNRERKGSPTSCRDETDGDRAFKLSSFAQSSLMLDGGMKFDKNFQIPKLSARTTSEDKKQTTTVSKSGEVAVTATKLYDLVGKTTTTDGLSKFPIGLPTSTIFDSAVNMEAKIRNSMNSNSNSNKVVMESDAAGEDKKVVTNKEEFNKMNYHPISAKSYNNTTLAVENSSSSGLNLASKSIDLTSKFVAPAAPKDQDGIKKDKVDCLLDFSSSSTGGNGSSGKDKVNSMSYPVSPSVSVHIVKSPSPLVVNPVVGGTSSSPCITDDELMDEALCLGK